VPTYQYACTDCGEQLEAVQSFSDPALTECPNCQGKLRKVFNSVGIVFKGSGFYRNDSRSGNVSAEKSGSDKSGSEKSGSDKSSSEKSGATSTTSTSSASSDSSSSSSSASKPSSSSSSSSTSSSAPAKTAS
jgi:putative FmdB family regulatory protein